MKLGNKKNKLIKKLEKRIKKAKFYRDADDKISQIEI